MGVNIDGWAKFNVDGRFLNAILAGQGPVQPNDSEAAVNGQHVFKAGCSFPVCHFSPMFQFETKLQLTCNNFTSQVFGIRMFLFQR